ncbi:MAG: hypothetical protein IJI23_00175 [Lachnospiraceae bacterium]|nr:hypothetical protein [Lachnospiraceae bacterium]MCR5591348.1 hypothetical protein [Lachnospiraceae bacterium]
MKNINLNLNDEIIKIELTPEDFGREAIGVRLFIGDEPAPANANSELMIEIQREETLRTTMVSIYEEQIGCFRFTIKKPWVEEIGEKPARLSLLDVFEETKDSYPAKWIVKEKGE